MIANKDLEFLEDLLDELELSPTQKISTLLAALEEDEGEGEQEDEEDDEE